MTTKVTTLYSYQAEMLTLGDAIAACQKILEGAIALLYSPQSCQLARLLDGVTLQLSDSSEVDLTGNSSIFEARIFNENCELRWLNRIDGKGDAVLLSELEQEIDRFSDSDPIACESLEQQYLLWGEKAKNPSQNEGWLRLAEARIGKLEVPLECPMDETQRVYLKTYEYLAAVGQYSNFAVIEERLVNLEVK